MRENAHLVDAVHLFGADLILHGSAVGADYGGVKTSVAVGLRDGDEVLEAVVNGFVELMKGAERQIALFTRTNDHAETVDVENVGKGRVRVAHAVVDAVDGLVAPLYLSNDSAFGQRRTCFAQNALEHGLSVAARENHVFPKDFVSAGIVIEKGQFLQFAKDGVEPQTVRDRHVDFKRFLGDAAAFVRSHHAERAQVVQTVGELDEDHAHVAAHGQKHFAKTFGLSDFIGRKAQFVEFTYAVDQLGDFHAEAFGHFNLGYLGVFENVMHEAGADRRGVQTPLGQNVGNGQRMRDVGFAGLSELTEMRVVGVHEGLTDAVDVGAGQELAAAGKQFGGSHDLRDFFDRGVEGKVGFLTDNVGGACVKIRSIVVVFVGLTRMRMLRPNDAGERSCRGCLRGGKQHRTFPEVE